MEESSSSGEGLKDASACRSEKRRFRLTKDDRVRRSSEYRTIMKEGARYRTSHFSVRMLRNPAGRQRLGLAVGKKAGNACARNRIKRRLREYFRLNRDKMPPETDMVFIALQGASTLPTNRLRRELDRFFEKQFSI
ncbi:MAG: ribonuclease P protein component [Desulfomonilaceae bacterium]|nr:ribonuclease P protein component [Desulfomonilaceae bacterium]